MIDTTMSYQPSTSNESWLNEIANTRYEPTESTTPGAIHTYGQIPGLNALIRTILEAKDAETKKAVEEERERIKGELSKHRQFFSTQPHITRDTILVSPPKEHDMVDWQDIVQALTPNISNNK